MSITSRFQSILCQRNGQSAFICLVFLLLNSCAPSASRLSYSHQSGEGASASMPGRIHAIRQKLNGSSSTLPVCVQTGMKEIPDENFMLELKLAVAAWLKSSVSEPEKAFSLFDFQSRDKCSESDGDFSLIVRSGITEKVDEEERPEFAPPQMHCETQIERTSCSTSLVRGFGSAGGYSIWIDEKTKKWVEIKYPTAAHVVLHPMIMWHSLAEEMIRNTKLADPIKADIAANYAQLLQSFDNLNFEDLMDLMRRLERHELIESPDAGFGKAFNTIRVSEKRVGSFDYEPESAVLHTLLHEVGHVFGMMHADNPSPRDISGESANTVKNSSGQFVTENSVMAYSLPYLYLLPDDKIGATALDKYARNLLDERFSQDVRASTPD
jgi:hypothetical protein